MPRGSKPGERRGGRLRGTPNKKTLLRDAAIKAAAADPDLSPLDFLLGLMRNPELPLDLRISMAEVAAPFVHRRPTTTGHPGKLDTIKYGSLLAAVNKGKLSRSGGAPSAEGAGRDQSPLDFLLEVMRDPETAPETRIRVARAVAPFVHPKLGRNRKAEEAEAELMDKLGDWIIEPAVAAAILEDDQRLGKFRSMRLFRGNPSIGDGQLTPAELQEEAKILTRMGDMAKAIKFPEGYAGINSKDSWILGSLDKHLLPPPNNVLSEAEEAVKVQLEARIAAYHASPEGRGRDRISTLSWKERSGLNAAEQKELDCLKALYPDLPDDPEHPLYEARQAWDRALAKLAAGELS
jgi:hypothetical protein